jgi:hypothetical protein
MNKVIAVTISEELFDEMQKHLKELQEALEFYGRHRPACRVSPCTCGFDALKAKLERELGVKRD